MDRRRGIICLAALGPALLCGGDALSGCANKTDFQIGPSRTEVYGAAIGIAAVLVVGTVVLVEVHKSHHTIKGCVTNGPDGLEVTNQGDERVYALTGTTASVKVGDIVRVHGSKEKFKKGSTVSREFAVEKINRDYGPCNAAPAAKTAAFAMQ
jgi:hypothetical protein